MRLGFRNLLIALGIIMVLASGYLDDWTIWIGAPVAFLGVILKYVDRGG